MANPAADLRLIAKAAVLYYDEGCAQQAIAERLDVSRPTVSRMLERARQLGIVTITVAPPAGLGEADLRLEASLEAAYELREVVVVPPGEGVNMRLGAAAASYLARVVQPDDVVGVTWGRTLRELVRAVRPAEARAACVVQTLGGIGPANDATHAADIPRRLAERLGADLLLLPVPGLVGSEAARDVLLDDPQVRAAFDGHARLTMAVVGIGGIETNPLFGTGLGDGLALPPDLPATLREAGAVGDVALRYFDAEGAPVATPLDARLVGASFAQLRAVKHVVGVAGGEGKREAIRGALRGGLLDVLVTDADTAAWLAREGRED